MGNEVACLGGESYGQTAIDIINQSSILKAEELQVISDLKDELVDNFLHSQIFRTRTEMEVSVLNDFSFPTPDSKYWQAQREQNVHFHELVMLSYEYRKNIVEIKKLKRKIAAFNQVEPFTDDERLEQELLQIEIEKLTFIARNQERVAQDRIREIREWHEIKARLLPSMQFGREDCDAHQLISYTKRWITQAMIAETSAASPAEKQNILSQMDMGVRTCISKRLIGKVLEDFDNRTKRLIANNYKLSDREILPPKQENKTNLIYLPKR